MKRRRITRQDRAWRWWIEKSVHCEWKISRGTSLDWNPFKQEVK